MKYTVKILIPGNTKRDFCMHFIKGQLMIHAKPYKTDVEKTQDGDILIYKFNTNYQKYGKVLRFTEFFNMRMKHSSTTKVIRKLATRHNATLEEGDDRFFDRPANIDVEVPPTVEEMAQANATWKDKIKKLATRLKVRFL